MNWYQVDNYGPINSKQHGKKILTRKNILEQLLLFWFSLFRIKTKRILLHKVWNIKNLRNFTVSMSKNGKCRSKSCIYRNWPYRFVPQTSWYSNQLEWESIRYLLMSDASSQFPNVFELETYYKNIGFSDDKC